MENNNLADSKDYSSINDKNEAEYVPKLFSEEQNYQADENNLEINDQENNERNQLFDQDFSEEEEFEIPAFLRKQKF